jgi:hypothetical protein
MDTGKHRGRAGRTGAENGYGEKGRVRNGSGFRVEVEGRAVVAEHGVQPAREKLQLTVGVEWLLGLMAHATAFAFARLFEPLRDTETVERTIMAMVEIHGGVYGSGEAEEK